MLLQGFEASSGIPKAVYRGATVNAEIGRLKKKLGTAEDVNWRRDKRRVLLFMTEGFSPTEQSAHEPVAAWKSTEALKLLNGDSELLRELCQIFLTESPKLMLKLQQALLEKDADADARRTQPKR